MGECIINGYELHKEDDCVRVISVSSAKSNYKVKVGSNKQPLSCTCQGFKFRNTCKHLALVEEFLEPEEVVVESGAYRFPRKDCFPILTTLDAEFFKPNSIQYDVAGSWRRQADTCKDLDIIILGNNPLIKCMLLRYLRATFPNGNVKQETDAISRSIGDYILQWYVPIKDKQILLDFHLVDPDDFESELLFFTGSKSFNIKMRRTAKDMGFKLNQYGLYHDDVCVTKKEKEIFNFLKMKYVEPKSR